MNHKRHRPKSRRAGCLMCKPHKGNGMKHKLRNRMQRRADDAAGDVIMGAHYDAWSTK